MTHQSSVGGRRGFSLVEMLLYIGISVAVIVTLLRVALAVLDMQGRANAEEDVMRSVDIAVHRLEATLRDARSINIAQSRFGDADGVLSLSMSGSSVDPTVFSLSKGAMMVREGTSSALSLTSSGVLVDQLFFQNLTPPSGLAVVRATIHARDVAADTEDAFVGDITLITAVTLRQ
jgi:hypothetical protein